MHKQLSIGATDPSYARGHGLLRPAEAAVGAVLAATLLGGCSAAAPGFYPEGAVGLPAVEDGKSNDAAVLSDEARRLAGAILAEIPSDMVCSPSCRVGTMNDPNGETLPGLPEYKYEVDMFGDHDLIQVIATQAESNPDEVRGNGVSVLLTVDPTDLAKLATANSSELTAGDFAQLVANPASTDVASLRTHNDDWFTSIRPVGGDAADGSVEIRWGKLGPEDELKIRSTDNGFTWLFNEALGGAVTSLSAVDRVAAESN